MTDRMGYETRIFYGTAGATATSPLLNVSDISENRTTNYGSTTVRGDSSVPPIMTSRPTTRDYELSFTMTNKTGDAGRTAILAAQAAGQPLAIRVIDYDGGTGVDADMVFSLPNEDSPLDSEQTVGVVARLTRQLREPLLRV